MRDQNGDWVSKNDESCHICIRWLKVILVNYEKYGTLSMLLKSPILNNVTVH